MSTFTQPPECPNGCECRWLDDADRNECACDGPCCYEEWDTLEDGTLRPTEPDWRTIPHRYVPTGVPTWRVCALCLCGANGSIHRHAKESAS